MGRMPKYNAKVDANEKDIISALRKIGADVERIGRPVDLLVGYRARNFLIEVKTGDNKPHHSRNKDQTEWIKGWKGQVRVVFTPEEAIELVTHAYDDRF